MINIEYSSEWNKINTKKELFDLLNKYKAIINSWTYDYLYCLLNLEFSVIRKNISDADRELLSELEIYKKVAKYNIYYRAKKILENSELGIEVGDNERGIQGIIAEKQLNNNVINIFDYNYMLSPDIDSYDIPEGFKTMHIGEINLFHSIENKEIREKELINVMEKFDAEVDLGNPYKSSKGIIGGPAPVWSFNHSRKLVDFEERFKKLDGKDSLTEDEKKEIEITNKIYELFLKDYGLSENDFGENTETEFINTFDDNYSYLNKTLIKKIPNLVIKSNIKYI